MHRLCIVCLAVEMLGTLSTRVEGGRRVDARAQVGQMSQESRQAFAQRIRSRLLPGDLPTADHDVSIDRRRRRGAHAGAGDSPGPSDHANSGHRSERPPCPRDHPHGRRVDRRGVGALLARPSGSGRPLEHRTHSQDGPADVLLTRAEHRYRATDGTRKFLVRTAGDLPDRPRQAGERAQPTLPGPRCRHRPRPSSFGGIRRRERPAHDFVPDRRRGHAHHGALGGRRVGPQPDAAQATGSQAGQRTPLQCGVVPRRHGDRRRPMERRPDLAGPPDRGRPCDVHQPSDGRGVLGLAHSARLRCHQRRHRGRPGVPQVRRVQHAGQGQSVASRTRAPVRCGRG